MAFIFNHLSTERIFSRKTWFTPFRFRIVWISFPSITLFKTIYKRKWAKIRQFANQPPILRKSSQFHQADLFIAVHQRWKTVHLKSVLNLSWRRSWMKTAQLEKQTTKNHSINWRFWGDAEVSNRDSKLSGEFKIPSNLGMILEFSISVVRKTVID